LADRPIVVSFSGDSEGARRAYQAKVGSMGHARVWIGCSSASRDVVCERTRAKALAGVLARRIEELRLREVLAAFAAGPEPQP
jgi:hypothetical protein